MYILSLNRDTLAGNKQCGTSIAGFPRMAFLSIKSSQSCWLPAKYANKFREAHKPPRDVMEGLVQVFLFLQIVYEYIAGSKNKKHFGVVLGRKYGPWS